MDGFSFESLPNSDQTVGPDDMPRRWVASPIAMMGTASASGLDEHTESKQGALSTRPLISAPEAYNCECEFLKATLSFGSMNADDCDWHNMALKHAIDSLMIDLL